MNKIRTMEELKEAIRELEDQDYVNEQFMRRRVAQIADDIKPVNIVKNLFHQAIGRSARTNLLRTVTGMGATWLIGKFFRRREMR